CRRISRMIDTRLRHSVLSDIQSIQLLSFRSDVFAPLRCIIQMAPSGVYTLADSNKQSSD
ncbi:hypothetical protein ACFC1D_38960, partial [Streptomyces vinaceus]|uniref:hypothetical protein n=1 Tax=Streptomyces vinaceus TaxID=1960 RepID=UPI0035D70EA2